MTTFTIIEHKETGEKWLANGAQPTETVKSILTKAGVWEKFQATKKK